MNDDLAAAPVADEEEAGPERRDHHRLDHRQREQRRHGRVDGVATGAAPRRRRRCERVVGGDDRPRGHHFPLVRRPCQHADRVQRRYLQRFPMAVPRPGGLTSGAFGPPRRGWIVRLLSPEEAARAARFVVEHDRTRWIVAHGQLLLRARRVCWLRAASSAVCADFVRQAGSVRGAQRLRFNLSHSADVALIAVARGRAVGIDVERLIERDDLQRVARGFFSPEMRRAVRRPQLAASTRAGRARKRSSRPTAPGLSLPLDSFDVSLDAEEARHAERPGAALALARPGARPGDRWCARRAAGPAGQDADCRDVGGRAVPPGVPDCD